MGRGVTGPAMAAPLGREAARRSGWQAPGPQLVAEGVLARWGARSSGCCVAWDRGRRHVSQREFNGTGRHTGAGGQAQRGGHSPPVLDPSPRGNTDVVEGQHCGAQVVPGRKVREVPQCRGHGSNQPSNAHTGT